MERPRPSTLAWIGLATYVAAYDVLAPDGETLSEGFDGALEHSHLRRALALGSAAITFAHVINILPEKIDPFHHALKWKK